MTICRFLASIQDQAQLPILLLRCIGFTGTALVVGLCWCIASTASGGLGE